MCAVMKGLLHLKALLLLGAIYIGRRVGISPFFFTLGPLVGKLGDLHHLTVVHELNDATRTLLVTDDGKCDTFRRGVDVQA